MSKNRIKWDLKKKAQRDADNEAKDKEEQKQAVLRIVQNQYEQWKKRLLKKKGATNQDVIAALYELMRICARALKDKGLDSWLNFTLELMEDKIATAIAINVNKKNQIAPHIPDTSLLGPDNQVDPIKKHNAQVENPPATFSNEDELRAIPFVKRITEKPGFIGFLVRWPGLLAMFEDEEVIQVGVVQNSIGIGKFPSWQEYVEATVSHVIEKGQIKKTDPKKN